MATYSDDKIRERAHKLWEKDGRQDGKADEYWHQAKEELDSDEPGNELETPKPMPE